MAPISEAAPKRRILLLLAGLGCLLAAVLVLIAGADPSPSTPWSRRLFGLWRARHVLTALALIVPGITLLLAAGPRRLLLPWLAGLVMGGLTLVLLQGIGMAGLIDWAHPAGQPPAAIGTRAEPHLDISGETQEDTASVWGLPSQTLPFRYQTDRRGFRNSPDRPPEAVETILLGDSILVGALVPFEETIAARLEALSARNVTQLALIGISPQREEQLLRESGLDLRGRLVIQFIFEGNDLLDSRAWREVGSAPSRATGSSLFGEIWKALVTMTDRQQGIAGLPVCLTGGNLQTFQWAGNSFRGVEEEAGIITEGLEAFAAEMRAAGAEFRVVFVPTTLRVLRDLCVFPEGGAITDPGAEIGPLRDHMAAWASQSDIPYLDLTPALNRSAAAGRNPWFSGDSHLNATGHDVAARAISDWLAQ